MSLDDDRELVVIEDTEEVIVLDCDVDVVQVEDERVLVINDCGIQGPPGPPGPPGGAYYFHVQAAPASAWVIDHNLGRRCHVTVYIPDGVEVEADVVHNSDNQVVINFPTPETGTALIA